MRRTDFGYHSGMRGDAATGYESRLSPMTPLFRRTLPARIVGANHGRFLSLRPFCVTGAAYGGLIGSPRDAARLASLADPCRARARRRRLQQGQGRHHHHPDVDMGLDLPGPAVVITGATGGLGASLARALRAHGANLSRLAVRSFRRAR